MRQELSKTLWAVMKDAFKEGRLRRRARNKAFRDEQRFERATETTMKEAAFAVLPQACSLATNKGQYPVSARQLYYAVRKAIQKYTEKELDFNYFSQTLLVEWQETEGPIKGLYFDPRGVLYEPHGGKTLALGTREVASYTFPEYVYEKILYVEKKGLMPVFDSAQIRERFDLAIIAGEGYPTEAVRTLFERADQGRYRLFVLHDADPHGYNIARTLAEETRRMPGYSVEVTDLGLKLEEALSLGLLTEKFARRKALPYNLDLNETERRYFEGQFRGHKQWECDRIELNAFTSPGLIEFLERKLAEAGADDKLIPPANFLKEHSQKIFSTKFRTHIEEEAWDVLGLDRIFESLGAKFQKPTLQQISKKALAEAFAEHPEKSWRNAVDDAIKKAMEKDGDAIEMALKDKLAQSVAQFLKPLEPERKARRQAKPKLHQL
jgi:hypothetical protein